MILKLQPSGLGDKILIMSDENQNLLKEAQQD